MSTQREVESRRVEAGLPLEGGPERGHRGVGAGCTGPEDAEVVPGEGVGAVGGDRVLVRGGGLIATAGLVQADAALVPQLRHPRVLPQQLVVELERRRMVPPQQVHLRHRLQHERAVLARLQRHAVFAQRLGEVALLPEREPELVVRERIPLQRYAIGIGACAARPPRLPRLRGLLALRHQPLEREVRLRPRQHGVERNGALGRPQRALVQSHVAVDEREQVVRFGVVGIVPDGGLERLERRVVEPAVVERFALVEPRDGAAGIELGGEREAAARRLDAAARLLGKAQVNQRGNIGGRAGEEFLERLCRQVVPAQARVGAAQFPACLAVVGRAAQAFLELRHAAIVEAALAVGQLEVVLRHLHARVDLERAGERGDRLADHALLVVEDPEVVVRAGVRRVDATRERPEDGEVAIGERWTRHRVRRCGWRRRWRAARAGRAGAGSARGAARTRQRPGMPSRRRRRNRGRGRN